MCGKTHKFYVNLSCFPHSNHSSLLKDWQQFIYLTLQHWLNTYNTKTYQQDISQVINCQNHSFSHPYHTPFLNCQNHSFSHLYHIPFHICITLPSLPESFLFTSVSHSLSHLYHSPFTARIIPFHICITHTPLTARIIPFHICITHTPLTARIIPFHICITHSLNCQNHSFSHLHHTLP